MLPALPRLWRPAASHGVAMHALQTATRSQLTRRLATTASKKDTAGLGFLGSAAVRPRAAL